MNAPGSDLAARYLRVAVRLLPAARRDWGQAMTAELGSIAGSGARWRFALGCTAAAVRQLGRTPAGWHPVLAALAVVAAFGAELATADLIGETVPLLVVLVLLAWRAGRPGLFGPARPDRSTRIVRAGAYVVGALGLLFVVTSHRTSLLSPQDKAPFFTMLITFVGALLLSITSRSATLGRVGLAAGAAAGTLAGLVAFLVMPFDRVAPPLLPGPWSWLAVVIFAAPAFAGVYTGWRTGRVDQAVISAFCAWTIAAVVTAMASLTAIAAFPGQIPDFVGPVQVPGTPLAERLAADATEAADPAAGLLAFGALLGAILWVVARFPLRRWQVILVVPLSFPPLALATSATGFPGMAYILPTTWILAVAVLIITGAAAPGRSLVQPPRPAHALPD